MMPREHEWDARWWSPIINAEHLRMREAAGVDRPDGVLRSSTSTGPGALDAVQRTCVAQCDVAVGKVIYTPVLDAKGGFRSDLTVMRLGDDHFRVVTGGAHGMADRKWFADQLAEDGATTLTDLTDEVSTIGLWGPRARDILASLTSDDVVHEGFGFLTCREIAGRAASTVLASRISYVGELGWELYVPMDRRRRAVGDAARGGRGARRRTGRDRRLRHHRPDREGLPRVRLRARRRAHDRRGRHAAAQGQGGRLRRQGGLPRSSARQDPQTVLCTLTVDDHTSASGHEALHARRRADPDAATAGR